MAARGDKSTRSRVRAPWRQALWYDRSVKPTVYIETSVVSYYTARLSRDLVVAAHQQLTQEWWATSIPRLEGFISQAVVTEASAGDPEAAAKRLEAIRPFTILADSPDLGELGRVYLDVIRFPPDAAIDAYHLAMATWHGMDYLVTWNCRHIASARVRGIVEDINKDRAIRSPIICTPEELLDV